MIRSVLKWVDPSNFVRLHRTLQFRSFATCGEGFRATERSRLFAHQASRSLIRFGRHALIDGTVEVYDRGTLLIGDYFFLGRSRIYCANSIQIGNYVLISDNVSIMDGDLHPTKASRRRSISDSWANGGFPDVYAETSVSPVVIGDDVWIGFGASILKGVSIGQGAIVGAGSLVTKEVPPWSVVAGSPARVIRELNEDER